MTSHLALCFYKMMNKKFASDVFFFIIIIFLADVN